MPRDILEGEEVSQVMESAGRTVYAKWVQFGHAQSAGPFFLGRNKLKGKHSSSARLWGSLPYISYSFASILLIVQSFELGIICVLLIGDLRISILFQRSEHTISGQGRSCNNTRVSKDYLPFSRQAVQFEYNSFNEGYSSRSCHVELTIVEIPTRTLFLASWRIVIVIELPLA